MRNQWGMLGSDGNSGVLASFSLWDMWDWLMSVVSSLVVIVFEDLGETLVGNPAREGLMILYFVLGMGLIIWIMPHLC